MKDGKDLAEWSGVGKAVRGGWRRHGGPYSLQESGGGLRGRGPGGVGRVAEGLQGDRKAACVPASTLSAPARARLQMPAGAGGGHGR